MDKRTLFELWAPAASPWSVWAKPAAFASLPEDCGPRSTPPASIAPSPLLPKKRSALVVDLPGVDSVALALGLVGHGYRPVPLFNACPAPLTTDFVAQSVVDVHPILHGLMAAAPTLSAVTLPADAPPAFLLDAGRNPPVSATPSDLFDNRSVIFGADFPSAGFLRSHGITRARLIHASGWPVGDDLRYALRHWAAEGVALDAVTEAGAPLAVSWPGGGFFGELRLRLFAALRLRRNLDGGYGAFAPHASSG